MGDAESDTVIRKSKHPCGLWLMFVVFLVACAAAVTIAVYFGKYYEEGDTDSSSSKAQQIEPGNPANFSVLILGAGMAGLRAGQILHDAGVNIQLIEGSDRIGGRVKEDYVGDVKVEVGATWYYGSSDNNPVIKLVKQLGIQALTDDYENYIVRNSTGHDVTEIYDELYEKFYDALEKGKELEKKKKKEKPHWGRDMSMKKVLHMYGWKNKFDPIKDIVEIFDLDFDDGTTPELSSLLNNILYTTVLDYGEEISYVTDQRGFSLITDEVGAQFLQPNDSRLHLNSVVKSIDYNGDKVKVITTNDEEYEADYAIVTFSLGVLQSETVEFIPALPEWKREVIFECDMSHYMHVFLKFDEMFWDDVQWIMHAHPTRAYYPIISPYDSHTPPGSNVTNILMTSTMNSEAYRLSQMTDAEIQAEYMGVLRALYGPSIPEPTHVLVPRWETDPLFYGAYSNRPYGFGPEQVEEFKTPLNGLYFAGEAVSDHEGFVHGAFLSGEETANSILDCITIGKCQV